MLTFLSAKTETIRLGTWVTPIPFRPPGLLAKTVATLDQLSQGRVILGVGAGVSQRMFEAYAQWDPPRIRVDKTRIPPWNKMSHQESKGIVLDAAKSRNRQERISFAYAYTPLGPADHYDRAEYGKQVEEAQRDGFEYFITAFSLTAPPWDSEASSPKGIDTYLKCLHDFANSFIPSYDK